MIHYTTNIGRTARRIAIAFVTLLIATTGTVAAHGGGSYGGGMMGGGWGLFGGTMGLWGPLWMGLLIGVPLYLGYRLLDREPHEDDGQPLSVLRERYARGEISDEEFLDGKSDWSGSTSRLTLARSRHVFPAVIGASVSEVGEPVASGPLRNRYHGHCRGPDRLFSDTSEQDTIDPATTTRSDHDGVNGIRFDPFTDHLGR